MAIYTPVNTLWKECRFNEKGECKLQRILNMSPKQQNTNHQESDLPAQSRQLENQQVRTCRNSALMLTLRRQQPSVISEVCLLKVCSKEFITVAISTAMAPFCNYTLRRQLSVGNLI